MSWQQYAAAWAGHHGGYDPRRASATVRGWWWFGYAVARALARAGTPAGAAFLLGVVVVAAVPVTAGRGTAGLLAAATLVLVGSFARGLDSALTVLRTGASGWAAIHATVSARAAIHATVSARAATRATVSARAAIRATVSARLGELAGLAGFWVAGAPAGLLIGCGVLAGLHELVRREALASGLSPIGVHTVGEHPMRVSVTVIGFGLAGFAGQLTVTGDQLAAGILTVAAVVWLLLALIGAGQLATVVRRALA